MLNANLRQDFIISHYSKPGLCGRTHYIDISEWYPGTHSSQIILNHNCHSHKSTKLFVGVLTEDRFPEQKCIECLCYTLEDLAAKEFNLVWKDSGRGPIT